MGTEYCTTSNLKLKSVLDRTPTPKYKNKIKALKGEDRKHLQIMSRSQQKNSVALARNKLHSELPLSSVSELIQGTCKLLEQNTERVLKADQGTGQENTELCKLDPSYDTEFRSMQKNFTKETVENFSDLNGEKAIEVRYSDSKRMTDSDLSVTFTSLSSTELSGTEVLDEISSSTDDLDDISECNGQVSSDTSSGEFEPYRITELEQHMWLRCTLQYDAVTETMCVFLNVVNPVTSLKKSGQRKITAKVNMLPGERQKQKVRVAATGDENIFFPNVSFEGISMTELPEKKLVIKTYAQYRMFKRPRVIDEWSLAMDKFNCIGKRCTAWKKVEWK